ncbi:MAG: AI-2E family transporter [Acidimicrobiales bacterium]|jgi:predicted PurR-regulated permease PerM|nr:AI-2E family transporter [Acidimicrobiales bacterium]
MEEPAGPDEPDERDVVPRADRTPLVRPPGMVTPDMPPWVPRAIALFFGGVVLLLVGRYVLSHLRDLIVLLLVSLFASFATEPAVNALARRGMRRGLATGLVFLALFVFFVAFSVAVGKAVFEQAQDFTDQAPTYASDIVEQLNDWFGTNLDAGELQDELTREGGPVSDVAGRLAGNAVSLSFSVLGGFFKAATVALFTFYLVADGPKLRRAICSTMRPERQREVLATWELAIDKTGGYIYSRAVLAVVSASVHWVAFTALGVNYAAALALFVGVVSQFIPTVGTYIAGFLPVLVAFLQDPVKGLWVLGFVVAYQQVENYLLAPRISARTMQLHPAVAFGAVIAGAGVLGGTGALLALPAAAMLQAIGSTYIERHPVVDSHLTAFPAAGRRARRRRRAQGADDATPAD